MCSSRKIHTHPLEGHQKFLGGGDIKAKILEAMYEALLEFLWGRRGAKQKTFFGGSKDIFWNYTIAESHQWALHYGKCVSRHILAKNSCSHNTLIFECLLLHCFIIILKILHYIHYSFAI